MMPEMGGYDFIRIHSKERETPIIILTAGALKEEVAEGYALGANDYIFKPFEPEDLIERIEKLL